MRGKIGAALAAVMAAVGTVGAATWARRRGSEDKLDLEVTETTGITGDATPATRSPDAGGTVQAGRASAEAPGAGTESAAATTSSGAAWAAVADDLTAIKGLGKVKVAKLTAMGITSYAQIAAWTDEDIAEVGLKVNTSPGQIKREDWVGQAKALAGD
jgi:large subunit ribosomal protein L21